MPPKREPTPGEDHGEFGPIAADHQVAAERQGEPGAHGMPVDLGDGRLGQPVERQGHVTEAAHAGQRRTGGVLGRAVGVAQIGARAEGPTGTGEDHHPVLGVGLDLLEDGGQLQQHDCVGRVLALGTVHGDGDHAALTFDDESFHGARP
jgi:hypothetical protein